MPEDNIPVYGAFTPARICIKCGGHELDDAMPFCSGNKFGQHDYSALTLEPDLPPATWWRGVRLMLLMAWDVIRYPGHRDRIPPR